MSTDVPTLECQPERDGEETDTTNQSSMAIVGTLLHTGRLWRVVGLTGGVNATIEYDGRPIGSELVRVNGQTVVKEANYSLNPTRLIPQFEFTVPSANGDAPARIDVAAKASLYGDTKGFRLTVAQTVVYAEGCLRAPLMDLPIPAHVAPPVGALPVAADAPTPSTEKLPLPAAAEGEAP